MLTLIVFLLVLSALVLIHEFGHYLAARIFGVKAEEFGWGFPPRAIGFTRLHDRWKRIGLSDQAEYSKTIWSLNWLPLGGFVRLKGEQGEKLTDTDSFAAQKAWKRLIIIVAGVVMNWLMAAIIISASFMVGVPAQVDGGLKGANITNPKIQIAQVLPASAADKAGVFVGDFLLSVNGIAVPKADDARTLLADQSREQQSLKLGLERQGQAITVDAKPEFVKDLGRPGLGVALMDTAIVKYPVHLALWQGLATTVSYTGLIVKGLYGLVRDLFVQHQLTSQVSGPVGIAVITGRIAQQGFWSVMQFTAMLSLNLAVINLLPIPALDGGRLAFIFVEWIRRRRVNIKFETQLHKIGFLLLLAIVLLVTIHDVRQYGGVIWQGLKHIVGL